MDYEAWTEGRGRDVIASMAHLQGATLPMLHALQATFGHVPRDAIPLVADATNLSRAEIHGVVTFYHDFRAEPAGRHVVKLCRAEACQSVGAVALADHAKRRLGIDWHGTTPDGRVTLEPVFCLGLCACGPAAMIDDAVAARLDAAALDTLLEALP